MLQRTSLAILALLWLTVGAQAQATQPATITVTPSLTPEPVNILDSTAQWAAMGTIDPVTHTFSSVGGTSGGGGVVTQGGQDATSVPWKVQEYANGLPVDSTHGLPIVAASGAVFSMTPGSGAIFPVTPGGTAIFPVTPGSGAVFTVQPSSGNFWPVSQPVTGTFWQTTQPVSGNVGVTGSVAVTGTFWQATQPISGNVGITGSAAVTQAAASVAAGAYPLGALADGAIVALGKLTDTVPCATPTAASCSLAQIERAILSSSLGALPAQPAHGVNVGGTEGLTASGVTTAGAVENPFLDGGRAATTEPTAVADGQKVSLLLTKSGKMVAYPFQIPELFWRGSVSIASTTAAVTVPNSTNATLKTYTVSLECYREDAGTTGTHVTANDTSSHIVGLPNNGGGGGDGSPIGIPLAGTAINTALTITPATSITPAWCSATGYFAP